jgi:hypothetical protein
MSKSIFALIGLMAFVYSTGVGAENDPQAGPQAHRELTSLFAPAALSGTGKIRSMGRQANEANYQLAIREGRRLGNPDHVTVYHVDKESGGRADARNYTSSANGLAQVVWKTHAKITGEAMTKEEHFRRSLDPLRSARLMAAHIAACRESQPHWTPTQLHRIGYMAGLRNCGSSLDRAAEHYARLASDSYFSSGNYAPSYRVAGGQS